MACSQLRRSAQFVLLACAATLPLSGAFAEQPTARDNPSTLKQSEAPAKDAARKPGSTRPPSGLWGESLKDGTDKGLKKSTGSPYNYRHIGLACVVFVVVGIGLVVLIRRHTREPRERPRDE